MMMTTIYDDDDDDDDDDGDGDGGGGGGGGGASDGDCPESPLFFPGSILKAHAGAVVPFSLLRLEVAGKLYFGAPWPHLQGWLWYARSD